MLNYDNKSTLQSNPSENLDTILADYCNSKKLHKLIDYILFVIAFDDYMPENRKDAYSLIYQIKEHLTNH